MSKQQLEAIRERDAKADGHLLILWGYGDRRKLIAEVDRLRAENAGLLRELDAWVKVSMREH